MLIEGFNLRVYGLLVNKGHVLITYEKRGGVLMTKFPGGGLEKGEGLSDCLIREFREEIDIEINPTDFFYVNDFLQISAYREQDQLISFYYFVETAELNKIPINDFDPNLKHGEQLFDWLPIEQIGQIEFTFPIDRVVAEKLSQSL